jgi:curved DNA-binding protein CbpA
VRRRTPLSHIDATLGRRAERTLGRSESPFHRFQEVDLEPKLRAWVEELDGTAVREALAQNEDRRRILYALLATGFLALRAPGIAPSVRPIAARREVLRVEPRHDPDQERLRAELSELARRCQSQDPFEVLGVAETAGEDEVRVAYEGLCKITHPDRVGASQPAVLELADQVFQRVQAAFEVLGDPRRRQEHVLLRRRAGREAAKRDEGRRAVEAELVFQKGKAALRQSDYERALAHFREAIELFPEEGDYHAHLGWALHCSRPDDAKRAEEAMLHVKRAIKLASDREKPYLFMGRICNAIGRPEAAMKMFTRALHIQPECVEALRELRLLNMRREREKGFIARILRR